MATNYHAPLLHKKKPIFGMDLGTGSIKIIEIDRGHKKPQINGYGYATFDPKFLKEGVIIDHEGVAQSIHEMVSKNFVGKLTARRMVTAVPANRSYNRVLNLPPMNSKDLREAIRMEAEQYIPVPIDDLYIDYSIGEKIDDSHEVLVVAAPRRIIDSYITLSQILGVEIAAIETTINASTRMVMHAELTDVPTLIIDFGARSTDLSIYDKVLRVTGSVSSGGDHITDAIAEMLSVSKAQAHTIKTKYGIDASKKQKQVVKAVKPILDRFVAEVKKMNRFYQDRAGDGKKLEQVIVIGGGANMPGLADYITDKIRIPTRTTNPWLNMSFGHLQPPHQLEKTLYATAVGLALTTQKEIDDD